MKSSAARIVVGLAVIYLVAGMVFGALAGRAATPNAVVAWRWAAWLLSAIAFGGHIVYEQVRRQASPRTTAVHVASAVGLGAFGLAVAANVHAQVTAPQQHSLLLVLSLVIWPVAIALPAFVAALLAAMLLARVRRTVP